MFPAALETGEGSPGSCVSHPSLHTRTQLFLSSPQRSVQSSLGPGSLGRKCSNWVKEGGAIWIWTCPICFFFSVIHCKTFCYWVPKWTRPRPQCRFISGTASLCDWLLTAVRHKARVVMKWFNCSLGEPPHLLNPSSALLQIMRHGIVSLLVETQCNLSPQTCMKHTNNFLTDTVKSLSLSCISYCLGRQLLLQQRDSNVLGLWSWDGKVWEWTTRQGVS